jgi:hypothetical protein
MVEGESYVLKVLFTRTHTHGKKILILAGSCSMYDIIRKIFEI